VSTPNNAGNSIIVRLKLDGHLGLMARVIAGIAEKQGHVGAIDIVRPLHDGGSIRDFSVFTTGPGHAEEIVCLLKDLPGVELLHFSDRTFLIHLGGKIEIRGRAPVKNRDDLSMAYTPGVARICTAIHENPADVYKLTMKRNMVAVVTDGSAVLGLGDIGPQAALPVMEGKAMLFKEFAGVDAFPLCLDSRNIDEIVNIVKSVSPGFGGINLEDISAPRCFEIEERLVRELDIPVFHDDQHGTAVVATAALINSLKLVGKSPETIKLVVLGAGAAGTACSKMMMRLGVKNIIACDRKGAIHRGRDGLNDAKRWFAEHTNPDREQGALSAVIAGADVFLGVSGPGLLQVEDVKKMGKDAVVFAMSNPVPEIMPEAAGPHAAVMATGRSDYPNQINNVLCFPGIFRGALDCLARQINEEMKMAAAKAIADTIPTDLLQQDYIMPSVFDPHVAGRVAEAVHQAAVASAACSQSKDEEW
ncbi:MAG: NAD-dependent malic enzyme, partial [Nitrospinaceae bacterium]